MSTHKNYDNKIYKIRAQNPRKTITIPVNIPICLVVTISKGACPLSPELKSKLARSRAIGGKNPNPAVIVTFSSSLGGFGPSNILN